MSRKDRHRDAPVWSPGRGPVQAFVSVGASLGQVGLQLQTSKSCSRWSWRWCLKRVGQKIAMTVLGSRRVQQRVPAPIRQEISPGKWRSAKVKSVGRRGQQWLSSRSASLQRLSPRIKHAYGTSFSASTDIYKPLPAQHEVTAESPSTVEDWLKAWLDRGTSRAGLAAKKLSARSARKRS